MTNYEAHIQELYNTLVQLKIELRHADNWIITARDTIETLEQQIYKAETIIGKI